MNLIIYAKFLARKKIVNIKISNGSFIEFDQKLRFL